MTPGPVDKSTTKGEPPSQEGAPIGRDTVDQPALLNRSFADEADWAAVLKFGSNPCAIVTATQTSPAEPVEPRRAATPQAVDDAEIAAVH